MHARPITSRTVAAGAALGLTAVLALTGCSDSSGVSADGTVEITLAGPNQWSEDGSSFGKPWEDLIARFEKAEPKIKVKTNVLPLNEFSKTLSTQLSAGTAPELVFYQSPHQPYMVHTLDEELAKPNPYVPGNKKWLDLFKEKYFGPEGGINARGKKEYIPFNVVSTGLFYNEAAFTKAGVRAPVKTFADLMTACGKLKQAGYAPLAMDGSDTGIGWTVKTISNMVLDRYYDELNDYAPDGSKGTAETVTIKSWAKAVLTGDIDATKTPEVAESVKLVKQVFDNCATKNWSGIAPSSASVVNARDFSSGKAAMAWGTPFGYGDVAGSKGKVSSMPFPTITKATTPLSTGTPARFGAQVGGTSYMIPSNVKGAKYDAAVKFLQWMSVPANTQKWLDETGALPVLNGSTAPETTKAMGEGDWSDRMKINGQPDGPKGVTVMSMYDGYLLGSKSLDETLKGLQSSWTKRAEEQVKDNEWSGEPWAKG
ncbi:ABC transporter substrate-binding protein [Streptomyces sp. NBC_01362]|uniref:ABC transporter substrate-binding protein n=1 Tax=Streptomyces sp. NBC_01362 TaxID=2903839 RepID=UPI002E310CB1|nr:ABC transporter substrate-binding protein [Streptomyces sp. NBC_01362]